jgi:rubredoxin
MTTASDVKREDHKQRNPLVEGRYMRCPRCKERQDVLRFVPMGVIEEYADETNPVYKCPKCRWVFSPSLTNDETLEFLQVQELTRGSND